MSALFDAVIVGGSTAGLSAALLLGRSRRRVLVCDTGAPRHASRPVLHGFLTRDGVSPRELARLADEQLSAYESVSIVEAMVAGISADRGEFEVSLGDVGTVRARRVLLATGAMDELPDVPGLRALWGTRVLHCPYAQGWEVRDARVAAYARGTNIREMAQTLTGWTDTVTLYTDGHSVAASECAWLAARGVTLRTEPVRGVELEADRLVVRVEGGLDGRYAAMFVTPIVRPCNRLAERLACALDARGFVRVNEHGETSTPSVFAAGDLVSGVPHQAIVAAATGATAAIGLNQSLLAEDAALPRAAVGAVKREVATRPLAVR